MSAIPITACEWRLGPAGPSEVRIVERVQRDGRVLYAVTGDLRRGKRRRNLRRTWPGENRESDEFHHERSHRRVDVVLAVLGSGVAEVMGAYRTIVADPPWRQSGGSGFDGRAHDTRVKRDVGTRTNSPTRPLPYPTMTVDEIRALPVQTMAADDAHLYLWATNRYVEQAFGVARAWGFRPVTLLTWCKPPMGRGLGGAFVQTTEFIVFARRGRDMRLTRMETTWWLWSRGHDERGKPKHSAKPESFIDVVEQVSPEPRLEMFSRRARFGWDYWGDESLGTAMLPQPEAAST